MQQHLKTKEQHKMWGFFVFSFRSCLCQSKGEQEKKGRFFFHSSRQSPCRILYRSKQPLIIVAMPDRNCADLSQCDNLLQKSWGLSAKNEINFRFFLWKGGREMEKINLGNFVYLLIDTAVNRTFLPSKPHRLIGGQSRLFIEGNQIS